MQPKASLCIKYIKKTITMGSNKFEEQMENLKTPQVDDIPHQQSLKIALLSANKSSRIGIAFIVIPCLFLIGVFIKYWLGIDFKIFTSIEDEMSNLDKISYLKWIAPLLLIGLPLISIIINSLAITHFFWDKSRKELLVTIKFRLLNIFLLLISIGIVGIFILYLIVENVHQITLIH